MSIAIARLARVCVIAAMVAFAPAASAVGQPDGAARDRPPAPDRPRAALEPEQAQHVGRAVGIATVTETIRLRKLAEQERIRLARQAAEDARITAQIVAEADKLSPGKWVWRPERAPAGQVEMVASLAAQRLYVFRSGKLIAVSTVSTGRAGHVTPTGRFPILQKKRMHHSNLYNNAPMPNMQRLTWDGVALHAGRIPGYAASHGCVRLPLEFSRLLFGITNYETVVHVVAGEPATPGDALAFAAAAPAGGSSAARAR